MVANPVFIPIFPVNIIIPSKTKHPTIIAKILSYKVNPVVTTVIFNKERLFSTGTVPLS